jgi:hypothetical protein
MSRVRRFAEDRTRRLVPESRTGGDIVNGREVQELVAMLAAAFPDPLETRTPESLELLRRFLGRLEYGLAEEAIWDLIASKNFWPAIVEIATAYDARETERRRQAVEAQERRDRLAADAEPTPEERKQMLELARDYAKRWATP